MREHNLLPMVAMVLDRYPNTKEDRYVILLAAEEHLRAAGIRIVAGGYTRLNEGRTDWSVSPWEGHPNEKANRVFAQEIAKVLRGLPELQPCRRHAGDEGQRRKDE